MCFNNFITNIVKFAQRTSRTSRAFLERGPWYDERYYLPQSYNNL